MHAPDTTAQEPIFTGHFAPAWRFLSRENLDWVLKSDFSDKHPYHETRGKPVVTRTFLIYATLRLKSNVLSAPQSG